MSANDEQVGGNHYRQFGEFQPWEVMRHWLSREQYIGYMKGSMISYLARSDSKGGAEDLRKVAHYSRKLLEVLDAWEKEDAAKAPGFDKSLELRRPLPPQGLQIAP